MENKLKTNLIKLLIKFNFCILKYNKIKYASVLQKDLNFNSEHFNTLKNYYLINPLELSKNLKQFLRLLQFTNLSKFNLSLITKNSYFFNLFKILNNINNLSLNEILVKKNISSSSKKETYIFFDNENVNYTKLLLNKNYTFLHLNSKNKNSDFGVYSVFSDFKDLKKLIFLMLFIKNAFNS